MNMLMSRTFSNRMLQKGACFCESFTINDKGFFINSGVANNGMKIDMFLDQSGKIISAFPEE